MAITLFSFETLKLDLINVCNVACEFCPYHGEDGSVTNRLAIRHEQASCLSTYDISSLAAQLEDLGVRPKVRFSGRGEATIHPEFEEIVRMLRKASLPLRIITNGVRLEQYAAVLGECSVEVVVSLHGHANTHDAIVQRSGSHERARRGIEALLSNHTPRVTVACVITKENLSSLPDLIAAWERPGLSLRLHHDFRPPPELVCRIEEVAQTLEWIKFRYQSVEMIPMLSPEAIRKYYRNEPYVVHPHSCSHFGNTIDVRSDGEVFVCRSRVSFGNIRTSSLREILGGSVRSMFLETVQKELKSADGLSRKACNRCCYQASP